MTAALVTSAEAWIRNGGSTYSDDEIQAHLRQMEKESGARLTKTERKRLLDLAADLRMGEPDLEENAERKSAKSVVDEQREAPPLVTDEDIELGEPSEVFTSDPATFAGRSHAEVLAMPLPEDERYLIADLIPAGGVGTIAGIPETGKSWLAQAIAVRVAAGAGRVLEREVVRQVPVGYFWQDDSTREETERVQLFARVHATSTELPLRWFLNEGLRLPDDLERLRATIEKHSLGLALLDSFYSIAPADQLRDEGAEQVVASLKSEVSDKTGCTILIVDHMPWATETNRGRLRAYGGVHKAAATRFGIYLDAQGSKLWIEARGNNLRGFHKTPAYFDSDTLELRLIDPGGTHEEHVEERAEKALAWLTEHPGKHSTTAVREAAGGRHEVTDQALFALKERGEVLDLARNGGAWSGKVGEARYWIASVHAASEGLDTSPQLFGAGSGEVDAGPLQNEPRPDPYIGAGFGRGEVSDEGIEWR
ncbi:MAG: AAA family ATPase [Gaiellaceae bacterium]|jgi:hypothetical protein